MNIEELRSHLKSLPKLADKGRDERKRKAKSDFKFFVQTYFPHHVTQPETSQYRRFIYKDIHKLRNIPKLLFFVYRGGAKTTLLSRVYPLWKIVRDETRNCVEISATSDQAEETIEFLKVELEENENLIADFDIIKGSKWQTDEFVVKVEGRLHKVKGYGSGKKIRGANFLSRRPDLIILDDIENDENVESKTQRDKMWRWFKRAILRLPDRTKPYQILVLGTLMHNDAVLKRISDRKDFTTYSFELVKSFPENMHLWENLYEMEDRDKAFRIFQKHRKTYMKGYMLEDTNIEPFSIMMEYFEDKESFFSEFQNKATSHEGAILADFQTYDGLPDDLVFYMGVDPALGKKTGALFGIVVVGRSPSQKRLYTVYAKGFKLSPSALIKKIVEVHLMYQPKGIAFETVQFQEFYKDKVKEYALENNVYLPVIPVKTSQNKDVRISSLSPYITDGTLTFNKNDHQLIEELLTYPKAAHVDILDTLEMAFRLAVKSSFDYDAFKKATSRKRKQLKKIKEKNL